MQIMCKLNKINNIKYVISPFGYIQHIFTIKYQFYPNGYVTTNGIHLRPVHTPAPTAV